jgi:DNA-binding LacI/PurR family transcriptional regulator
MKRRVTLTDIAKVVGVSHVTVSLALRNHPSISEATKERVRASAKQLGYRPDPALTSLIYHRYTSHQPRYQATLAWVNAWEDREYTRTMYGLHLKGAQRKAEQMGYQLEDFWLYEEGMTERRFSSILRARRIQGLLLPSMPKAHTWLNLPWKHFSAIAFGYSHEPLFHLVTNNQYQIARLAVEKLHALGYRKIGLLSSRDYEERTEHLTTAGYTIETSLHGLKPLVLSLTKHITEPGQMDKMLAWIDRKKPDVLLSPFNRINRLLEDASVRVPQDIALALISRPPGLPHIAGVDHRSEILGETAVERLVGQINQNELGLPAYPLRTLLNGSWCDGPSCPPRQ